MKRMLVNANDGEECRIAIVEDGKLSELYVEISDRESYLGNIYKGKVVNIEPSIGAAFVNFGGNRNGFLHASDVIPAYADPDVSLIDILEGRARAGKDEGPDAVRAVLSEEGDPDDTSSSEGYESAGEDLDSAPDAPAERRRAASGDGAREDSQGEAAAAPLDLDEEPSGSELVETGEAREDSEAGEVDGSSRKRRRRRGRRRRSEAGEADAEDKDKSLRVKGRRGRSSDEAVDMGKTETGKKREKGKGKGRTRSRVPIQDLLKKGQEIIVQITKEGIGAKGPTLTTYLSLPGRCLVLMPSLPKCGVSRKIADDRERRRLKRIVRELDRTGQGGIGFIVRTAGVGKSAQDVQRDLEYLEKLWGVVVQRAKGIRAPASLYVESDLVLRTMRDHFTTDIGDVVIDSEPVYKRVCDFVTTLMPRFQDAVKHHESIAPLFHAYGIETSVEGLYQPRVELAGGGSIVVEQTEALVAIDVNSGKFKPGSSLEETAFRTNLDAIPEIVRQLRLRDLGGLIIVDFIDMMDDKHRRVVERKFRDALKADRARINVGRISNFGLLELTRQRVGPGLKRTVFQTCPTCKGTSLVRTVQSKALAVLREMRALAKLPGFSQLDVYAHSEVAYWLENRKRRTLVEIEDQHGIEISLQPELSYPVEVVHYRFLDEEAKEVRVSIPAGLGVHM
ncbi:MAG: ribonuclease E [Planctomycetota bacterium]|nr:MAG: ribonuclease E [Planctomycetota bacterium]